MKPMSFSNVIEPRFNSTAKTTISRDNKQFGMVINPFTKEMQILSEEDRLFQK